jgi:microcystin-dependent protein
MAETAIAPAGSRQTHANRQPYLAVNYIIIALRGIFPARS